MRIPRTIGVAVAAVAVSGAVAGFTLMPAGADDGPHARALPEVRAVAETPAEYNDDEGGNVDSDDPAIWRNDDAPGESLVIAAVKEGGMRVFDLDARLVQSVAAPPAPGPDDAPGRLNNVDLVDGFELAGGPADLAVASDRGHDTLRIYTVDPDAADGPLVDVTSDDAPRIFTDSQEEVNEEATAYGLATYTDPRTGTSYALVSRNARTSIALLELVPAADGTVTYREVRTLDLPDTFELPDGTSWMPCDDPGELPQVEGMVVDPETGTLWAGQETVGIWRLDWDLTGEPVLQDKVAEYGVPATYDEPSDECVAGEDPGHGGELLAADVEGLTLLQQDGGDGYLLASSQGDNTFVAYDREEADDYEHEGGFGVVAGGEIDGSEECDGAHVLNEPLGEKFPNGLMVVQDGHATPEAGDREATNFKFVDLGDVLTALDD